MRQITEFILNARGDWDKIVNSYLQEGQETLNNVALLFTENNQYLGIMAAL